jgi:hypothetical protein
MSLAIGGDLLVKDTENIASSIDKVYDEIH